MPRFRITVAYDGTDFVGWQRQSTGVSIQGLLEDALAVLDDRPVVVTGAGRTDAGVHALGQVASFSLTRAIDAAAIVGALNARLPPAVRVLAAGEVDPGFHARYGARSKTYRYRIWNGAVMSPFERRYAWHVASPLDVGAMAEASAALEGRHDFAAFRSVGSAARTTVRTVFSSKVRRSFTTKDTKDATHPGIGVLGVPGGDSALMAYEITGDGFLRHMVRTIAGTLVEIGRGRWPASALAQVLASGDRTRAGPTAPPEGLFLVGVEYGDYNV